MDDARIAELLAPFLNDHVGREAAVLSPAQLRSISIYVDILQKWNARVNLTAIHEPEEIITRHFGESFFTARHLFSGHGDGTMRARTGSGLPAHPHLIDVGSGAGFPGLPIKIWAPQVSLTLIEANQKKATFLREVVRRLDLSSVDVFTGRASAFPGPKGDFVTLRAVERFESVLPEASGLVSPVGCLAIMVGAAQQILARGLVPTLHWTEPVRLPLSSNRVLIIGRHEPH